MADDPSTPSHRFAIVGSSPKGLLDYRSFHCRWPAVLLVGSEKHGLSDQLAEACDFTIRLPMLGRGDSINAAVAGWGTSLRAI
jgi:TrmH family RNA methyltransferase